MQHGIIRKLVHLRAASQHCVVGDDAQSIYAFRGATIQNILDFEKDFSPFGIKVFKLEENYRSTEHIVQAANEVIRFNKKQIQKKIWSSKGTGQKIKVIKTMTDAEEGKRVADTISEQRNRFHPRNTDIAVLYRTNAQSRVLEEYLRRYNIPYKIFGGLSFYQRKEVKDLIAYLRLAINPKDEEALRRVINFPKRGIGDSTVDKISELAGQQNLTMWEVLLHIDAGTRTQKSIHEFVKIVQDSGQKTETLNAHDAALYIAKQSKLIEEYNQDKTVEGLGRLENLNALLDGIKSFVEDDEFETASEQQNKSLASYLQNIALLTDQDDESKTGDYVTLMSCTPPKVGVQVGLCGGIGRKTFPVLHVDGYTGWTGRGAPFVLRGHHPRRAVPDPHFSDEPLQVRPDAVQRNEPLHRGNPPRSPGKYLRPAQWFYLAILNRNSKPNDDYCGTKQVGRKWRLPTPAGQQQRLAHRSSTVQGQPQRPSQES